MDGHGKQNLGDSLSLIIKDAGVMQKLHTENEPKMVVRKTCFFKLARKEGTNLISIEPNIPDENYGENILSRKSFGLSRLWLENEFRCDCGAMQSNVIFT